MSIYQFLSNGVNSIISKYTTAELKAKFIIRDEFNNNYIVFNDIAEYAEYIERISISKRCFHEIIFGNNYQKIKFDLDIELNDEVIGNSIDVDSPEYIPPLALIHNVNELIDIIISTFHTLYKMTLTYEDLIITDSSGYIIKENSIYWKYSYHIIINNYYVESSTDAKYVTNFIYDLLPDYIREYIDIAVNKQIQNFRLIGCTKSSVPHRYKNLTCLFNSKKENLKLNDFIVNKTNNNGTILPKIAKNEKINTTSITNVGKYIDNILHWLKVNTITEDHEFRGITGDIISFNRINNKNSCRICGRIHDNDNSLFIKVTYLRNNKITLTEYCHRNPQKYNTLIQNLNIKAITAADNDAAAANNDAAAADNDAAAANNDAAAAKKSYLQILIDTIKIDPMVETYGIQNCEIYSEPYMRKYNTDDIEVLCIKGNMGCGKTERLYEHLREKFHDDLFPQCIRFITFRQTFAKSLLEKFDDFQLYSDINGDITQNNNKRVIIQVESLHRLVLTKHTEPIDLLILDEIESILSQFNSGLHRNFNLAFAIFQWMISTAKTIICIDANLCERSINTLRKMRPNINDYNICLHYNKFNRETEYIYKITNNNSDWLNAMLTYISEDKKIVLPTNSLLEAKVYKKIIEDSFPTKRLQLYSSEMPMSEKNEHFSNIEQYWAQLDILIYTPTCSAGISFTLCHFDYVFAHLSDASCDVETSRQMLMRIRDISSKLYYIYFPPYSSNRGNYPTSVADIEAELKNKKLNMLQNYDGGQYLNFEYTADGDIMFYKTNYYHLWLENIRIGNLSKNQFVKRFIQFTVNCGATIELLTASNEIIPSNYKNAKKEMKELNANNIALAKNITQSEQIEIQNKIQCHIDVSIEEIRSLDKYYIKEIFNLKYENINNEFILIYNNESVKKVFKYLSSICKYTTVEESLNAIQRRDIDAYSIIGSDLTSPSGISYNSGFEYQNLVKYKFTYTNHLASQRLIQLCGFAFIHIFLTSNYCISFDCLYENIKTNIKKIEEYLTLIECDVKIVSPGKRISDSLKKIKNESNIKEFIKKIIKIINAAIYEFYGIKIKTCGGDFSLMLDSIGNLFKFVSADAIEDANADVIEDANADAIEDADADANMPKIICNLLIN